MNINSWKNSSTILCFGLIFVFCILILFPVSPLFRVPGVDSGVFLYIGSKILDGKIPYLDLWDHKPPLVYYINALGLLLGQGNIWGVWSIELFSLLTTSSLLFITLKKQFHQFSALTATLGMIACLPVILSGGNLTEEYGLFFQVIALFQFVSLLNNKNKYSAIIIGFTLGATFLLKQTLIGLWVIIGLYWFKRWIYNKENEGINNLIRLVSGSVILPFLWITYLYFMNALGQFWDAAFLFNFVYSSTSLGEKLASSLNSLTYLFSSSSFFLYALITSIIVGLVIIPEITKNSKKNRQIFLLVFFVGSLFIIGYLLWGIYQKTSRIQYYLIPLAGMILLLGISIYGLKKRYLILLIEKIKIIADIQLKDRTILIVVISNIILELFFASISARGFLHYYIPLLPSSSFIIAYLIERVSLFDQKGIKPSFHTVCLFVILLSLFMPTVNWLKYATVQTELEKMTLEAVKLVNEKVLEKDKILILGSNSAIYFLSNQDAASPYFYQYPLFTQGFVDQKKISQLIRDIDQNKPALIINMNIDYIENSENGHCAPNRDKTRVDPEWEPVITDICKNYYYGGMIGGKWIVYQLGTHQ